MQISIAGLISYFISLSFKLISSLGPSGVLLLMIMEGIGIPFPSEIIMTFAGFVSSGNLYSLIVYSLAGSIGGFVGNLILYYISLFGGRPIILTIGKYIGLKENHLLKVENWFNKGGEWTVFFGRFVPGFRSYMSIPAGIVGMNVYKFSLFTFTGSLIWSTALAAVGYETGANWGKILPLLTTIGYVLLVVFLVVISFYLAYVYRKRIKR